MGHADFDGRDVVVDGQCKVVNADFAGCIGAWDGCGCMQILLVARALGMAMQILLVVRVFVRGQNWRWRMGNGDFDGVMVLLMVIAMWLMQILLVVPLHGMVCGCMQILHVARGVWDGESNFAGCEGGGVCGTSKLMFS